MIWKGVEEWRAEASSIELEPDRVRATGTQVGDDPLPYRLDYALDTGAGFLTERLALEAAGDGWRRSLVLTRDDRRWDLAADASGDLELPAPGGELPAAADALDCDLGYSPLTNLMPILRHGVHRHSGSHDIVVTWVAVPELTVFAARQRYEHLAGGEEPRVRFTSLDGADADFTAELELDRDGLIRSYPQLARRA